MERRSVDAAAPPALRGASLGFLWSTGFFPDQEQGARHGIAAVRRSARPAVLGDFLAGLFATAREEVLAAPGLVAALDGVVAGMEERDFHVALPALRLAFSFFPPPEKETIAGRLLALRGGEAAEARLFLRLPVEPSVTQAGIALEARVGEILRRFGLEDPEEQRP
jgi:hypothetical protein